MQRPRSTQQRGLGLGGIVHYGGDHWVTIGGRRLEKQQSLWSATFNFQNFQIVACSFFKIVKLWLGAESWSDFSFPFSYQHRSYSLAPILVSMHPWLVFNIIDGPLRDGPSVFSWQPCPFSVHPPLRNSVPNAPYTFLFKESLASAFCV